VGGERLLVSIGRLTLEKNWKTLIAAFSEVVSSADDVLLMLIGDGFQRGELEDYAKSLGVYQKIIFTGQILFEEIRLPAGR
jgi:glycosyltransferase involved in cell wall biosynthesis